MPTRDHAPAGAPCWIELTTPDVAGATAFYSGLFGWRALNPEPTLGGYVFFEHHGHRIAGCMPPDDPSVTTAQWTPSFHTATIDTAAQAITGNGGTVIFGPMDVADLGRQLDARDPSGARFGL